MMMAVCRGFQVTLVSTIAELVRFDGGTARERKVSCSGDWDNSADCTRKVDMSKPRRKHRKMRPERTSFITSTVPSPDMGGKSNVGWDPGFTFMVRSKR